MIRYAARCFVLTLVAACATFSQAMAQEATTFRFSASSSVFFPGLGAIAGASEEDPETITILMVPPAAARPEAAREVDLQDGDIVLMAAGKRLRSIDDLRSAYEQIEVGDPVKLGIQRGEKRFLISFPKAESQQLGEGGVHSMSGGGATMVRMTVPEGGGGEIEVLPELGVVLSEVEGLVEVAAILPIPGGAEPQLQEGDTISAINGRAAESLESLIASYRKLEVGAELELTVDRGGASLTLELSKPAPVDGVKMIRGSK